MKATIAAAAETIETHAKMGAILDEILSALSAEGLTESRVLGVFSRGFDCVVAYIRVHPVYIDVILDGDMLGSRVSLRTEGAVTQTPNTIEGIVSAVVVMAVMEA